MIDYILWILVILGIFFHELGHWLAIFIFTKKIPEVKLQWYGISVGNRKLMNELTFMQYIIVMAAGVIAGMPFFWWNGNTLFLIYLLVSSFDLAMIIGISQAMQEYKLPMSTKIVDLPCERCMKLKLKKRKYEKSKKSKR